MLCCRRTIANTLLGPFISRLFGGPCDYRKKLRRRVKASACFRVSVSRVYVILSEAEAPANGTFEWVKVEPP